MLPWQPILSSKLAKSAYSRTFVDLAFENGLEYCNSDFKRFVVDDLAKNLLNLGWVTSVKNGKYVHPSSISCLAIFAWRRHCWTMGISTEFCGAISTQFCFTYLPRWVTATPRRLYARFCHAIPVPYLGHLLKRKRDDLINPVKMSVRMSVRLSVRTSTIKHNAATNQIVVFVKVDETFTTIWLSRSSEVRVKVRRWPQSPLGTIFILFRPCTR